MSVTIIEREHQPRVARTVSASEKYCYSNARRMLIVLIGLLSAILLMIGQFRFALTESLLWIAVPFVIVNGIYMLLSYGTMLFGRSFDLAKHTAFLDDARQRYRNRLSHTAVDVFLPICGEDRQTILDTWDAVRNLNWPGTLEVYVLDDSKTDALCEEARQRGFHYLRRPSREFKKAGNLRHAFSQSSGEFILLLDADFCPRQDMLLELVPYLVADERMAIVQSPQFFDVRSDMNWVEAGAGYVQELFYRLIQPARDRWNAAVCVGSCAVYRRSALEPIGGAVLVEHSEDMWTGFDVMTRGWSIRYLPIVLAKGCCPDTVKTFLAQQYRWCYGSLSLVSDSRFWRSSLTPAQKLCYVSGFCYYIATAINAVITPLPPLLMVCCFPYWVHWNHLAFSILALVYTPFLIGAWSVYRFGFHFLTTREVSAGAHLAAVNDFYRGRLMPWVITGSQEPAAARQVWTGLNCLLASSGIAAVLIWAFALRAIVLEPERWFHFIPPLMYTTLHAVICWRAVSGERAMKFLKSFSTPIKMSAETLNHRLPPRLVRTACVLSAAVLALAVGLAMWSSIRNGNEKSRALADEPIADDGSRRIRPPRRTINAPLATTANPSTNTSRLADLSSWAVENAFPNTSGVERAMRMREHPRRPGVYYLAEFSGIIKRLEPDGDRWKVKPVVNLAETDLQWIYSIALHPRFPEVNRLYVTYRTKMEVSPQFYRLSAIDLSGAEPATSAAETILIEQEVEHDEHLGGDLAFDSDGFLFFSVGDNAKPHSDTRSQRIDDGLFSGILRIDVDCRGGNVSHVPPRTPARAKTRGYYIPNDNPFVGQTGVLEEFWAIGLRNPFRISFDESSDRLWIGEVGQDSREQVELAASGTNHMWSFQEGTAPYARSYLNGSPPPEPHGTFVDPIFEYPHEDQNYCVVGGIVYWGAMFPELQGKYIFGDNQSGRVWALDPLAPKEPHLLLQLPFTKPASSLVSIETDQQGNLFFTNFGSWPAVYKLVRTESLGLPEKLSETRLFSNVRSVTPTSGFVPYEVSVPLWSDGMRKRRWFRLPAGHKVNNQSPNDTAWRFPPGTIFLKHFEKPRPAENDGWENLETRILIIRENGTAVGATYLWDQKGTEAHLQRERATVRLPIPGNPTADPSATFNYRVPGFRDCTVCHNQTNPVLGVNLLQLNCVAPSSEESDNQLLMLSRRNLLQNAYTADSLRELPALAPLGDKDHSLEERARSYLHANCSSCHFHKSLDRVDLDLRHPSLSKRTGLIGEKAKLHYVPIDGKHANFVIAPGKPMDSAIYLRMQTHNREVGMPYLGRTVPDTEALDVIAQWIRSLDSL